MDRISKRIPNIWPAGRPSKVVGHQQLTRTQLSYFRMCCIVGNYTGTPAWQTSIPTKIPQTSKIAPETPRNYKRETTREKLVAGGRQTNRKNRKIGLLQLC